jgi:hypothetical protein
MSRNIPEVRKWCIRYYNGNTMLAAIVVNTINKQFAKWEARDAMWANGQWRDAFASYDRVTVSLVKGQTP